VPGGNEGQDGDTALPARFKEKKRALLRVGVTHINTPFLPYDADWQARKPFERWEHPAMKEPGVIGEQLRLDEVADRYGLPQRVRTPSATSVVVVGSGEGGGAIVKQEPRGANMPAEYYEPVEWGGGVLVHPIDDTWKPNKAIGGDRDLNDEVISKRQSIRKRYYKYSGGKNDT
jgi:hypothetical protein